MTWTLQYPTDMPPPVIGHKVILQHDRKEKYAERGIAGIIVVLHDGGCVELSPQFPNKFGIEIAKEYELFEAPCGCKTGKALWFEQAEKQPYGD